MSEWKDPRKNIYTITVVSSMSGFITHIETHSNKKKAQDRLERLTRTYVKDENDSPKWRDAFRVELHTTKLERKTRWE